MHVSSATDVGSTALYVTILLSLMLSLPSVTLLLVRLLVVNGVSPRSHDRSPRGHDQSLDPSSCSNSTDSHEDDVRAQLCETLSGIRTPEVSILFQPPAPSALPIPPTPLVPPAPPALPVPPAPPALLAAHVSICTV